MSAHLNMGIYVLDIAGAQVTSATYAHTLKECGNHKLVCKGKWIHAHAIRGGTDELTSLESLLIEMYGKCGNLDTAWQVFQAMQERNKFSWRAILAAYVQHQYFREALGIFHQMLEQAMKLDKVAVIFVLKACRVLATGKWIHAYILNTDFVYDAFVLSSLLNMYGKCESLDDALSTFNFNQLRKSNVVLWTIMIEMCAHHGRGKQALQLFRRMRDNGNEADEIMLLSVMDACSSVSDLSEAKLVHAAVVARNSVSIVVRNSLISMYAKCGRLYEAQRIFYGMADLDTVSWNSMLAAYMQHAHESQAIELFKEMCLTNAKPTDITFVIVLGACGSLGAFTQGKAIDEWICNSMSDSMILKNALINMYSKCGFLECASRVFNATSQKNTVTWTSMVAAYAQHGYSVQSLLLFRTMWAQGMRPNRVTFLNILTACSYEGLINEGWHYFISISRDHNNGLTVAEFGCLIDLLGRAGFLDEAQDFVVKMPLQPSAAAWKALLAACKVHADAKRAKFAAEHVFELDPEDEGAYALLRNIYAA